MKTASKRGWTYPELIVTMGVIAVLVGLGTMNLNTAQHKTYSSTTLDTLAADMSLQQVKAMTGDVSVSGTKTAYGVYFQSDRYILFKGNSYNASDPENFTVMLNPTVSFSAIGFNSSQIIYAAGSGAFSNYASGYDTVTLTDTQSNNSQVLHVNTYGVLDQVN